MVGVWWDVWPQALWLRRRRADEPHRRASETREFFSRELFLVHVRVLIRVLATLASVAAARLSRYSAIALGHACATVGRARYANQRAGRRPTLGVVLAHLAFPPTRVCVML